MSEEVEGAVKHASVRERMVDRILHDPEGMARLEVSMLALRGVLRTVSNEARTVLLNGSQDRSEELAASIIVRGYIDNIVAATMQDEADLRGPLFPG